MKILSNVLYLEFNDLIQSGVSENTLKQASARNSQSWSFIEDPADKRKVLIEYEKLKQQYKDQVVKRFGNPYEFVAKEPIRKMVVKDIKAEEYFLAYRYDQTKFLPIDNVNRYVTAASWLNMLVKAEASKKEIKKLLNLCLADFWIKVCEIIKTDNIDLPSTYQRLRPKLKEYETGSYTSLIHKQFGNSNAKKVCTDVAESLLLEMIAHPNQYDDTYICMKYNQWAASNEHSEITPGTVGNYRRKNYHTIITQREGQAQFYDKYGKEVKGRRPSTPLYLVESDDNHLDLFFLDPNDNTPHKYYHKFKTIVVTDSFNDYVLGYAYAEKLTAEVVKRAYLNAMYHIKQLTGAWHVPHEIKTDRWALEELRPLYSSLSHYYDTPVGSKRRGYIEQFFGSSLWKNSIKEGANNYTGNNITARKRGVNNEMLTLNRKDYPTVSEAPAVIENFFNRLRLMPGNNGMTKQQEWLTAFEQTQADKKKLINDEQFLLKLGTVHAPSGRANRITNGGVEPQINNKQYWFDVPEEHYLHNVGKSVNVIYDPYDLSRVLITDNANLRFIATTPEYQSRAMADYKTGERTRLNELLATKTGHAQFVTNATDKRKTVLSSNMLNVEATLQSGVLTKEIRQMAELNYQAQSTGSNYEDPIDQM